MVLSSVSFAYIGDRPHDECRLFLCRQLSLEFSLSVNVRSFYLLGNTLDVGVDCVVIISHFFPH